MSQPGPISARFPVYNDQFIGTLRDYGHTTVARSYNYRPFWMNRMAYFDKFIQKKVQEVNENKTIETFEINELPKTIQEMWNHKNRKTACTRVIIYGLLKRFPKDYDRDLFLIRNEHPNMEDVIAGHYMPGFDDLERKDQVDPVNYKFDDKTDKVYLEDYVEIAAEVSDIEIKGKCLRDNMYRINTGRPVVLIGRFNKDDATFSVENMHFIEAYEDFPMQISPFQPTNRKVLCLTDLFLGENLDKEKSVAKLNNLLSNLLTGIYDTDSENNPLSHIVLLGGIFHSDAWKLTPEPKRNLYGKWGADSSVYNPEIDLLKMSSVLSDKKYFTHKGEGIKNDNILSLIELGFYVEIFDQFLSNLLEMYPVTLLPGRNDLGHKHAPHSGISRSFFPQSSKYKNFRCCKSSISDMKFTDEADQICTILGISHKLNYDQTDEKDKSNRPLEMMLNGLLNNELIPGVPFPESVDLTFFNNNKKDHELYGTDLFMGNKVMPELILLRNKTRMSGILKNGVRFVTCSGSPSVIDLRDLSVETF